MGSLDEFIGVALPRNYFIGEAAHMMKMTMDEHGMTVIAGTGMGAKGINFRDDGLRGITIDFTEKMDGFLCFVQSTDGTKADSNAGAVCLSWLYG